MFCLCLDFNLAERIARDSFLITSNRKWVSMENLIHVWEIPEILGNSDWIRSNLASWIWILLNTLKSQTPMVKMRDVLICKWFIRFANKSFKKVLLLSGKFKPWLNVTSIVIGRWFFACELTNMYCNCKMQFQKDRNKCARARFLLKNCIKTRLNKKSLKNLRSGASSPRAHAFKKK